MRRNMDLVKEILSEVKNSDPFSPDADDFHPGRLPGHWKIEQVSYHLVLLVEEGFLARHRLHVGAQEKGNKENEDGGLRLTWRGHDLLEELENNSRYGGSL